MSFGFTLGFLSYACLDQGRAILGYLPLETRSPLRRAFASVGQAKVPDLTSIQQSSIAIVKQIIPVEKQLQEAERRHSGKDNPELEGQ